MGHGCSVYRDVEAVVERGTMKNVELYASLWKESDIDVYTKMDILHQLLDAGVKRERIITPIEPLGVFYDKNLLEVPEFA